MDIIGFCAINVCKLLRRFEVFDQNFLPNGEGGEVGFKNLKFKTPLCDVGAYLIWRP